MQMICMSHKKDKVLLLSVFIYSKLKVRVPTFAQLSAVSNGLLQWVEHAQVSSLDQLRSCDNICLWLEKRWKLDCFITCVLPTMSLYCCYGYMHIYIYIIHIGTIALILLTSLYQSMFAGWMCNVSRTLLVRRLQMQQLNWKARFLDTLAMTDLS